MKILMTLANPFTHDPRVYNEAKSLVKAGHEVTVLAWDKKRNYAPNEIKDGVNIVRSYNTKFMDLLPYDIFRLHFWWNKGFKDAINLYKKNPFDIIHSHDLSSLPIGIKIKNKLKLPLIYDAHEIWGFMVARDLPKIWANYYLRKEKKIIDYVDCIITVNDPLKKYFCEITDKPIVIIMNCKPLQSNKYEPPNNKNLTLVYFGTLSKSRFLLELADVVKEIPNIRCIIGGTGSKLDYVNALKKICSKSSNVEYVGEIPMEKIIPMTKKGDVVVCMTSPDDPNNSLALTNKQFEAMVCGRPIICTKETYPGEFTEKENCGITVYYNEKDFKKVIKKLRDNPKLREKLGKNALKSAIREYNWESQEKKLFELYRSFQN